MNNIETNELQDVMDWVDNEDLPFKVWVNKYRNNNETLDEWLNRVSGGNNEIKKLIAEKKFIFGGRILASRGLGYGDNKRKVSLSNCYVIEPPEDNIESIFNCASKLARTYSYGGGCGTDLSNIRPNGAIVNNAAKTSTGVLSFMDVYSQVTSSISQNGRRGALMLSLSVMHPDVVEFVNAKTDLSKVNYANISVRVNEEFMKAVENDEDFYTYWPCNISRPNIDICEKYNVLYKTTSPEVSHDVYIKKIKAKDLFNKLVYNNWQYAEPGILYWNNIEKHNLLNTTPDFKYAGTNPCAEEPLPSGGSCLLGSINLGKFVKNSFEENCYVDFDELKHTVKVSIDGLNEVLHEGLPLHPLQEQRDSVNKWRQIGLGIMGLHDMLIRMKIKYGSQESLDLIVKVFSTIALSSIKESMCLVDKYGVYPGCKKEYLASSDFMQVIKKFDINIYNQVCEKGLANSQVLTCAPTGTIASLLNASSGIEPLFALKYNRTTKSLENKDTIFEVYPSIVREYKNRFGEDLPDFFVDSSQIDPEERVKVQATIQYFIDASISSTINLPKESTVQDVYKIYMNAYKHNLKGVTVYRSGCAREPILSTKENTSMSVLKDVDAPKRPKKLPGNFELVKVKGETFGVIVGLYDNRPYEIFALRINTNAPKSIKGSIIKVCRRHYKFISDDESFSIENINSELSVEEKMSTILLSLPLRHGVNLKYIIESAKKANDNIASFTSAICRVLGKYMINEVSEEICPECGGKVINEGGCCHCVDCGWSRCS